jgi:hypothetical protein
MTNPTAIFKPLLLFALLGCLAIASTYSTAGSESQKEPTVQNETSEKVLRHIVLFRFKETSSDEEIEKFVAGFRALPGKIDEIIDFEWGRDVSVEGKTKGFTHAFLVTFRDEAGRDAYLPHPAHEEFVALVGPHLEDVLVVDYWAQP